MPIVQAVAGAIDTSDLGRVLMHEHVIVLNPEIQTNYPGKWSEGRWDEEAGIADAVAKLRALKAAGFETIVDVTVVPMGRQLARIKEISERSEVNIIAATGLYTFDVVPAMLASLRTEFDGDPLVELFVRDIRDGSAAGGVRAAIIKCATDAPGITPGTERVLKATAAAHRLTGVPITTHSRSADRGGLEQQRVFADAGVDLARVIIGHCGDTTDVEYLEALIDAGSYIGMDRFGLDYLLPFEDRVEVVAAMCERGHAQRMLLSHDAWTFNDWFAPDILESRPNWHYRHIAQDVLPALRRRGVTEVHIDTMLVDNPRRLFECQEPY